MLPRTKFCRKTKSVSPFVRDETSLVQKSCVAPVGVAIKQFCRKTNPVAPFVREETQKRIKMYRLEKSTLKGAKPTRGDFWQAAVSLAHIKAREIRTHNKFSTLGSICNFPEHFFSTCKSCSVLAFCSSGSCRRQVPVQKSPSPLDCPETCSRTIKGRGRCGYTTPVVRTRFGSSPGFF